MWNMPAVARPEKTRQGLKPRYQVYPDPDVSVARPEKTRQGLKRYVHAAGPRRHAGLQGLKKPDRD